MEKYTMFLDQKNQYSENEYPTQRNLQIQCNPYEAVTAAAKLLQLCPTLCDPIDSSPPGSPMLSLKDIVLGSEIQIWKSCLQKLYLKLWE